LLGGAFAGRHADDAFAATSLGAKRAYRRALDETAVRDADNAALVGDEILHVDLAFIGRKFGSARAAMLVANLPQLFLDDGEDALLFGENIAQILDRLDELSVFIIDLLPLQPGQLIQ